ncbi:MAG: hypothetical protein K1X88_23040 [Nannocystaceae bacterium]|nr:hypothetical protein [Nannocystaceae bacterium]
MRRRAHHGLALALALAACRDDGAAAAQHPAPHDPTFAGDSSGGTTATSAGESSTTDAMVGCGEDMPCAAGSCAAAALPGDPPQPGPFTCGACVETGDVSRWCLDDGSCCDATMTCLAGLCRDAVAASSDGGSTGAGSSSGSDGGSSSSSSGGSSSGGAGSSGSSTGGA